MAEHAADQVAGYLADREQAAENELARARAAFEGAQNALRDAADYLDSVRESSNNHRNLRKDH